MHWDQEMTKKLMEQGLSWDHARIVVGEMAEQRQIADAQGFNRGFESGYDYAMELIGRKS